MLSCCTFCRVAYTLEPRFKALWVLLPSTSPCLNSLHPPLVPGKFGGMSLSCSLELWSSERREKMMGLRTRCGRKFLHSHTSREEEAGSRTVRFSFFPRYHESHACFNTVLCLGFRAHRWKRGAKLAAE